MELAELDALISRYRDAERRFGANLLELDANPTLKMLTAGRLTGETARALGPAIAAAPSLWRDFERLRTTLSDAEAVRGAPRRPDDAARAELERILTTSSVTRDADGGAPTDAGASGAAGAPVSIDALLATMDATYESVCVAVVTVERIWSQAVPRLDAARAAVGPLRAEAAAIDITAEPALDTLDRVLADVDRKLGDDPVALTDAALAALDAALEVARTRIAELRVAHDTYDTDVARAHALLTTLTEDLNAVRESYADVVAKIVDPPGVADLGEEQVAAYRALRSEAATVLAGTGDRGVHWRTRRTQLDAWIARASALDTSLRDAASRNLAPVRTRDELRGLLSALEAKAASRRRIERPAIIERLRAARDEAGGAPCDLARLTTMVDALARDLSTKDS